MFGGDDTEGRARGKQEDWSDGMEPVKVSNGMDVVQSLRQDSGLMTSKLKGKTVWKQAPGFTFKDPRYGAVAVGGGNTHGQIPSVAAVGLARVSWRLGCPHIRALVSSTSTPFA